MVKYDYQLFSNIAASTSDFTLQGGKYGLDVAATFGGGSVKLQKKLADGSAYVSVASGTDITAAGYGTADCAPGTYRLTVATATGVYACLSRIPL